MTTETTTTEGQGRQSVPRCRAGSKGEHPCPRQATKTLWPEESEPTLCDEHAHAHKLGEEAEDLAYAHEQLEGWISTLAAEGFGSGTLEQRVYFWRDELIAEAARATTRAEAAKLTAMPRDAAAPGEGKPLAVRELMSTLLVRCDALTNARAALLKERELSDSEKLAVLDALAAAAQEANEEAHNYRAEHFAN